jgi:ATP-dependent DNA ligase
MNIDKRNFSNFSDKKSFPGCIDTTTGEYHFQSLFHTDSNNNKRIWEIKVRLVKGDPKKYGIDWDVLIDDTVVVKQSYLEGVAIPDGTSSQVWVTTGVIDGKISRHSPTYPKITNEGKSNERNVFEQGLVEARSLYLKKIENGLKVGKDFNMPTKITKTNKTNIKYFPMLVRKFDAEKKNLKYPLYIQPKLDGARCIAYLNKSPKKGTTTKNVILYSRQKKDYTGFDDMREELLPALVDMWDFARNESAYIDGELYKHGMSLQTISGAVRNPNRNEMSEYRGIKYWIFDIFYPSTPRLEFKDRLECLEDFFDSLGNISEHIVEVPTHIATSEVKQEKLYKGYLKKKYEGIILRNFDSLYLTHPSKNSMSIRSKFVLKRKMTYSDEFEVVGFDQGKKGRDKGAIMWVLKTHTTNKRFNATPKNITYEERYKLYKNAMINDKKGFVENYNGRMMTIEYEDLSKDEIPLRAKSIGFREHI